MNTSGWSFNDKLFAHELDHHYHLTLFSADPQKHLDFHHVLGDKVELDATTHLCLHAAGQYPPFLLNVSFLIMAPIPRVESLIIFVSKIIPESIPGFLFRSLKNFWHAI